MANNRILKFLTRTCWFLVLAAAVPAPAMANSDWMNEPLVKPGSAGLGMTIGTERSPYKGAGYRYHAEPLYLYEGERFFLHPARAGIKVADDGVHRFDLFLDFRMEGYPQKSIPASLAGMQLRESTTDIGVSYAYRAPWGNLRAEYLHDVLDVTKGSEARFGYSYNWSSGRWHLRPSVTVALRSASLNNYYYGVLPGEATATRPAYMPGSGVDITLGAFGYYDLSGGWKLLGGLGLNRLDGGVRGSPIVHDGMRPMAFLGAAYDFGSPQKSSEGGDPLIVKVLYGKSSDCLLNQIITFRCTSTSTTDNTRIAGVELGRPFVTRPGGWPVDIVGYIGLLGHDENGRQPDSLEFNAYMKAYYYGFPWREKVRTRVGFGAGISYAQRVPFIEAREQAQRGRGTSRILNYLNPTIDFSVGDLIGSRAMKETYLGLGTSHRSGMFGSSQVLGNVDGGSNFIYTYLEWLMK